MTSPEQADVEAIRDALTDMLAGWKYIRGFHGDLYGVGWDRAQEKAERAILAIDRLAAVARQPQPPDVHLAQAQGHAPAARTANERSLPDGWQVIAVNEAFDKLMSALDRAERKGYMPDAMADEWGEFQWKPHTCPDAFALWVDEVSGATPTGVPQDSEPTRSE
jgi:hypothetical protein